MEQSHNTDSRQYKGAGRGAMGPWFSAVDRQGRGPLLHVQPNSRLGEIRRDLGPHTGAERMTIIAAGVDVGRDSLDVAIAPMGRGFRAPNVAPGIKVVVDRLKRAGVTRVVLESIGAYGQRLVRALAEAGFEVGIVDPRRIKALRLAEGKRAKTDRLDARLIARFALLMSDAARPVPDADAFKLRALSTRRRQLVEMIAMEKTRL
jgi:hypothetical protein